MTYAKHTSVPAERSKAELERILARAKADQFATGWAEGRAIVSFRLSQRMIRIEIPMPVAGKTRDHRNWIMSETSAAQETRRRWRAVILYVKAKLESVESNIVSFEEAFMSHIIMPNGKTVGQNCLPQIAQAYSDGKMPPLLGYGG